MRPAVLRTTSPLEAALGTPSGRAALATAIAAALLASPVASAALGAERVLDQLSTEPNSIVIQFNCPMSFVSNYPLRSGDELRIELQPLPGCPPPSNLGETLPVARDNPAGLVDVRLEQSLGSRRALTVHFARTVDYLIKPRPGLTGIEVVLSRRVGRASVEPANPPPKPSRAPTRSLPTQEELDRQLAAARAAMQDREYDAAIRLYTKLLEYPEHAARPRLDQVVDGAREVQRQRAARTERLFKPHVEEPGGVALRHRQGLAETAWRRATGQRLQLDPQLVAASLRVVRDVAHRARELDDHGARVGHQLVEDVGRRRRRQRAERDRREQRDAGPMNAGQSVPPASANRARWRVSRCLPERHDCGAGGSIGCSRGAAPVRGADAGRGGSVRRGNVGGCGVAARALAVFAGVQLST